MNAEARRALRVLEVVAEDRRITQRGLASRTGTAVGLTNLYLKRLASKGFIKFVNVRPNRILYLLTPKGIAEKSRLTYEFMEYSLHLYRQARHHLRTVLEPYARNGCDAVAIFGVGEAAELAYLALKDLDLEPVAIFSSNGRGTFLGMPIQDVRYHDRVQYDFMVIASLEKPEPLVADLVSVGVSARRLITLRPTRAPR